MIVNEIFWRYLVDKSYIRGLLGSSVKISNSAIIKNSKIIVYPGASISIGENCKISNANIFVHKGNLNIGDFSIIKGEKFNRSHIDIEHGNCLIGHHTKLACERIWLRFNGNLTIGDYTNINGHSELRCDEKVEIGSYCRISYNVRIWDTNTHEVLSLKERRNRTEKYFPIFGKEFHKPPTKPVIIGDDCWLGEYSAILKGSIIGDASIVGFRTTVIGENIPSGSKVINKIQISLK